MYERECKKGRVSQGVYERDGKRGNLQEGR